jgi:uncharacterized protein (DUF736 family)
MAEQTNISGSLFRNERKEKPNQPDFTGPGSVTPEVLKAIYEAALSDRAVFDDRGAIKVRIAGWKKESAKGTPYISLAISLEQPKQSDASASASTADSLF